MAEKSSEDWFLQREDRSNFQYAGMYLMVVATLMFIFVMIDALIVALDNNWPLINIWNFLLNLLVLTAGFVVVYLIFRRRNFPLLVTLMTMMLAVSVLNLFNLTLFKPLSILVFVTTLISYSMAIRGEREFPTPRLQKRIMEAHIDRHPILRERHKKKSKAQAYRPGIRELDEEYEEVEGIDCPNCGEFIADDEDNCPSCDSNVDSMLRIEKVQIAYQSGQITAQQYQQAMQNLQRRR